jgi:HK97 family phage prohead protease
LKNFNRAGSFYYQHMTSGGWFTDPNPDYVLGIATAKVHEKELVGSATFEPEEINQLAEKIYKKVNFGTLKNTSVGFTSQGGHWGIEKKGEDPTAYYFDHAELLEFSIVNIPSNPDAIKKSLESMNNYMLKEVEKHQSSGFQKDYFRELQLRINKQIF